MGLQELISHVVDHRSLEHPSRNLLYAGHVSLVLVVADRLQACQHPQLLLVQSLQLLPV